MITERPFIVSIQLQSYQQFKYLENAVSIIIQLKKIYYNTLRLTKMYYSGTTHINRFHKSQIQWNKHV